jgi:hypothetical protein
MDLTFFNKNAVNQLRQVYRSVKNYFFYKYLSFNCSWYLLKL